MISTLIVNPFMIPFGGMYMAINISQMELLAQQLHQAHRNTLSAELSARGLSEVGHPMLLTILKSSQETSTGAPLLAQRELAQQLHISPAAVANSLKSLERSGYIRRQPGPGDARRNQVLLTEKGYHAVEGCQRAFDAVAEQMLEGFTPQELELIMSFRLRMLQNLRPPLNAQPKRKEES